MHTSLFTLLSFAILSFYVLLNCAQPPSSEDEPQVEIGISDTPCGRFFYGDIFELMPWTCRPLPILDSPMTSVKADGLNGGLAIAFVVVLQSNDVPCAGSLLGTLTFENPCAEYPSTAAGAILVTFDPALLFTAGFQQGLSVASHLTHLHKPCRYYQVTNGRLPPDAPSVPTIDARSGGYACRTNYHSIASSIPVNSSAMTTITPLLSPHSTGLFMFDSGHPVITFTPCLHCHCMVDDLVWISLTAIIITPSQAASIYHYFDFFPTTVCLSTLASTPMCLHVSLSSDSSDDLLQLQYVAPAYPSNTSTIAHNAIPEFMHQREMTTKSQLLPFLPTEPYLVRLRGYSASRCHISLSLGSSDIQLFCVSVDGGVGFTFII